MSTFRPDTEADVAAIIRWAVAEAQPLELLAGGSKRGLGRPSQADHTLDLSALSGILDYEPAELVLTASAGTPLSAIEETVAARSQMLAFEPPDWRALLGTQDRTPTLGGMVSCNLSGPRRIKAGAARDHLLGFRGVNGRGDPYRAGGKVVKNVTGYDLCKLLAGAYGTLTALTELSIKVLPRPETVRTVVAIGLDEGEAITAMTDGLNSPHEISGAAHLPVSLSPIGGAAATLLRVEGPAPSVAHRCAALRAMLRESTELDDDASGTVWRDVGDVAFLAEPRARAVWRVSVPPASGAVVLHAIRRACDARAYFDWGGGLLWVAAEGDDGGAAAIRGAIAAHPGSHATLIRASDSLRASVPVFQPLAPALAAISSRVKHGFDPLGVLNPGRIYAGA